MKHLTGLLWVVLMCVSSTLLAQQEEQYTMFMLNKLYYNPAYAGADAPLTVNAATRHQWVGFDGAPSAQKLSSDFTLFHARLGMGFHLVYNTMGISKKIQFTGSYAYRVQVQNGYFGVGVNASIRYTDDNYQDKRLFSSTDISMDGSIPMEAETSFSPDFGIGFYYKADRFYIGASLPNMLNVRRTQVANNQTISLDRHHYYLMTGYSLNLNRVILITPQILLKYVAGAPLDGDINVMTTFDKKYKLGLGYRLGGNLQNGSGESFDVMFGLPITTPIFFGLSYDMTISKLSKYNSGSIEAILQYRINNHLAVTPMSPRFF